MGKRELLLAVIFLTFGFVVYQFTKPAGDPNRPGWSFGGIIEEIRREVRGNQGRAELTKSQSIPAPATLREIKIDRFPSEVVVVGEDRADIALDLKVTSRAYDDAEAKKTAEATKVLVDQAGELLTLTLDYPREGQQTASLSLKVPKRLNLRVDEKGGRLRVSNLGAVLIGGAGRGETVITDIAGPVQAVQRGSAITITNVGSLKLTTFNTGEAKISNVRGDATCSFQGGEIRGDTFGGALEIESRNADIKFERLEKVRAPLRVNAIGGELVMSGVQVETRIDARRTDVRIEQSSSAPLAIYSESETVEVTLAPGGFVLDAVAVAGRITVDKTLESSGVKVSGGDGAPAGNDERREWRASGTVKNGGPTVTLRSTRGEIVLRSRN